MLLSCTTRAAVSIVELSSNVSCSYTSVIASLCYTHCSSQYSGHFTPTGPITYLMLESCQLHIALSLSSGLEM